jgi:hypothetical protein
MSYTTTKQKRFNSFENTLPNPDEMKKITRILKEIDNKLDKLSSKKKSYQQLSTPCFTN